MLVLLWFLPVIGGQTPTKCPQLPNPTGKFSEAQLQWMCDEKLRYDRLKQGDPSDPARPKPLTTDQKSYLNFVQTCDKGDCLIRFEPDANVTDPLNDKRCRLNEHRWRPKFCDPQQHPKCRQSVKLKPKFCEAKGKSRNPRQNDHFTTVLRKEYRMLSDAERNQFHTAVNRLKSAKIDGLSKWDILITSHYPEKAPGAHWGPAFLPWHREFLRQVEIALRNEDPTVSIPYWDSTLDSELPDRKDSLMWSDEFMGNGDAFVTSGPFGNWPTATELPGNPAINRIYRDIGKVPFGDLFRDKDVQFVRQQRRFANLTACVDPTLELAHGLPHLWVGGFMGVIRVSPNDPIFFLHHSFVDYLWEQFRQSQQTANERISDWPNPNQLCDQNHSQQADMKPFENLKNIDGLSERYTEEFYHYDLSPICTTGDCGSKYLFCYQNRCRAKIRVGGNCTQFPSDICFNSVCIANICVPNNSNNNRLTTYLTTPARTIETTAATVVEISTTHDSPTQSTNKIDIITEETLTSRQTTTSSPINRSASFVGSEVFIQTVLVNANGAISNGVVTVEDSLGTAATEEPVKNAEFPEYSGLVYVPIRVTNNDVTIASLKATHKGQRCRPICFLLKSRKYASCTGKIKLSLNPDISDPIPFSSSIEDRKYLNCDLSHHPAQWRRFPPAVAFLCDGLKDPNDITKAVDLPDFIKLADTNSPQVFFHVLVVSRSDIYDRSVPGAKVVSRGLSYPDVYSMTVPNSNEFPNYAGVAHVTVKNPGLKSVQFQLAAYDQLGQKCLTLCKADDSGSYRPCSGVVTLSADPQQSDLFPYTTVDRMKSFVQWNMTGHPKRWARLVSPMEFGC